MHMSDALLSPAVGGSFWAVSGGLLAWSARKIRLDPDSLKTPLMAVTGAFVFAAQMINFTIPGTGSSGHLGGGLLLAALLGPHRAFLTLASVLTVQCLFFADGGLMALGCNIFNLAFFPAFVAYPFLFRPLTGNSESRGRLLGASITAGVAGLFLGSLFVVLQTVSSGVTDLPFRTFALFMLPVHAAIGIVEGLATFGVVSYVRRLEPALLARTGAVSHSGKGVIIGLLAAALILAGFVSRYASEHPDGLEWSVEKTAVAGPEAEAAAPAAEKPPVMDYSPLTGLLGSLMVLTCAGAAGFVLRRRKKGHSHP